MCLDSVTLDSDSRHVRRLRVTTGSGRAVMIDLAEATVLRHGDALAVEEGLIEIRAAPEPLLEITMPSAAGLARIAWHLGNRHTQAELTPEAIFIQPDHVLEHLAQHLGGTVRTVSRPFQPEAGAYGHGHGHDHGH